MLWLALYSPTRATSDGEAASPPERLLVRSTVFPSPALACWAGRFTPHVNLAPAALRLEVAASLRLFGGLPELLRQVRADLAAMNVQVQLALAATPLAALWLARAGGEAICADMPATRAALAAVPLTALQLAPPLARRSESFGLRRVGDLLALPRAGLGARLGKPLLVDLARALGEVADPQLFYVFPEHFEQGLELPAPVAAAPLLLFAARRLSAALAGWLAARNAAVLGIECLIDHGHGTVTKLPIAFSAPVHRPERIERVFREQLDTLRLCAPALALRLRAEHVEAREDRSLGLFDGAGRRHDALADLMDRLVARLGAQAVQGLACHADHRPELASRTSPEQPLARRPPSGVPPRPLWLVEPPEALREHAGRPQRRGPLTLRAGPERIEAGWWDGSDARRDYFVAVDSAGCWLWIFRDPRPPGGWFLHGWFA